MLNSVVIREGREKSILRRHPWIFSGAVYETRGNPAAGEIIDILDSKGAFLARGYYNPVSKITARILEWNEDATINGGWWEGMLRSSIARRDFIKDSDAMRLVFAEADLLPGLIVDRYGPFVVMQALTAGIDSVKHEIANILYSILEPEAVMEKNDDVRELEGLKPSSGRLAGGEVPETVEITENGTRFIVDLAGGQKTGFFLDQRDNRLITGPFSAGRDVLDCFCYTGGFTLSSLRCGAKSVTAVDSSGYALALLGQNLSLNGMNKERCAPVREDAFTVLRRYRDEKRLFDMVVLDPPKFAPSRSMREKAMKAYKDINLLAMKVLRPDGILATFSCSGAVGIQDLRMAVAWAGIDAEKEVQVIRVLSQAGDHPVRLSYPESEYLKGLICRVF